MNSFMETFDGRKLDALEEKQAKETSIVTLLDKITRLENVCAYVQSRKKEGEVSVLRGLVNEGSIFSFFPFISGRGRVGAFFLINGSKRTT